MAKPTSVSDLEKRISELEAENATLNKHVRAYRMYANLHDTYIESLFAGDMPFDLRSWRAHSDALLVFLLKEKGEDTTYAQKCADRSAWVRDNPEEVKRRADAVREDLRRRAALQAGNSQVVDGVSDSA